MAFNSVTYNTLPNAGQSTAENSLPTTLDTGVETTPGTPGTLAITIQGHSSAVPVTIAYAQWFSATVTPTLQTTAYTNNSLLTPVMNFPNIVPAAGGGFRVASLRAVSKSVQSCGIKVYLFNQDPTNTTWTVGSTPSINVNDLPFIIGQYTLGPPDSGLGTETTWQLDGIDLEDVLPADTTLYAVAVVSGTPTFGADDLIFAVKGVY